MESRRRALYLPTLFLAALVSPGASAEVSPGNVIDRANWQKAEGLLPEPVLNWIKQGDVLQVGKLSYDPGEYLPPACLESLTTNIGKYDIDENGLIVDVNTGALSRNRTHFYAVQDINDYSLGGFQKLCK
ncbi:MAG: hypothetical protein AB1640_22130 [bacterium]